VQTCQRFLDVQRVLAPDAAILRRREMEDRLNTAKSFVQVRQISDFSRPAVFAARSPVVVKLLDISISLPAGAKEGELCGGVGAQGQCPGGVAGQGQGRGGQAGSKAS